MKAYYAHCQSLYNTKQEERDLDTIKTLGFIPINPNDPELDAWFAVEKLTRDQRMMFFKPMVTKAKVLVFRALPGGAISSGVALEIEWAREANIPVLELPSNILQRKIGLEQTLEYIREIGKR